MENLTIIKFLLGAVLRKFTLNEIHDFYEFYKNNSIEEVITECGLTKKEISGYISGFLTANIFLNIIYFSNFMILFENINKLLNFSQFVDSISGIAFLLAISSTFLLKKYSWKFSLRLVFIMTVISITLILSFNTFPFYILIPFIIFQSFLLSYIKSSSRQFKILPQTIILFAYVIIWNILFKTKENIILFFVFAAIIFIFMNFAFSYDRYKRIKNKLQ